MDKTYTVIKGERGSGRIFHLERALSVKSAQLAAANKEVSRLEETNVSLQNTISILMCEVERLNEAQQWISVKDRLPQYTDEYNVTVGVPNELGYFETVKTLRFERIKGKEPRWVIPNNETYRVIAWKPLPEKYQPPKGE